MSLPPPRRPAQNFRWRSRAALACVGAVAATGLLDHTIVLALGPKDRRLTSARAGVSVEAPPGWTLSQHTGYADTIVLLLHPDGSRMSVTAAATPLRDAAGLYQQNRPGLLAQGLLPTAPRAGVRGSLIVDLGATARPDRMRQLYLVRDVPGGHQAVVLTLVAASKSFALHTGALDSLATHLTLDDPLPPPGANAPRGGAPDAKGTGGTGGGRAAATSDGGH